MDITESEMPSNRLILCWLLRLPSVFPSIRVYSSGSALCIRWPKYWSSSINPSNEHTGLLFLRIPLRLTGLIALLSKEPQHHNSKASILRLSNFFMVQLSHPYMTTGKNIALDRNYLLIKYMKFKNSSPIRRQSSDSCYSLKKQKFLRLYTRVIFNKTLSEFFSLYCNYGFSCLLQ